MISKHGILIVEFANKLTQKGLDRREAVLQAASLRLRPILMTTFATVLGVWPLVIASGAGANSRFSIGLMITALLAVTQGCDCIDLGSDVSVDDIIAAVKATDARCVSLSCVTRKPSRRVVPPLSDLCNRLPMSCELWLGGRNACDLDAADLPERCVRIAGTDALQQRLDRLCASKLPNA